MGGDEQQRREGVRRVDDERARASPWCCLLALACGQQDGAKADKGACHRQKESDVESVQERACGGGLGISQHGVKGRPPGDGGCQKQGVG